MNLNTFICFDGNNIICKHCYKIAKKSYWYSLEKDINVADYLYTNDNFHNKDSRFHFFCSSKCMRLYIT